MPASPLMRRRNQKRKGRKKCNFTIYLTPKQLQIINRAADKHSMSMSWFIGATVSAAANDVLEGHKFSFLVTPE